MHRLQQKGPQLLFDLDPDVPEALLGDPLRPGQIRTDLTTNVVKFTEQGVDPAADAEGLHPCRGDQLGAQAIA